MAKLNEHWMNMRLLNTDLRDPNELHDISHTFSQKTMCEYLSWDRVAKLGVFRRPGLWGIWRAFGGSDGILDGHGGVDFDVLEDRVLLQFDMWELQKQRKGRGFWEIKHKTWKCWSSKLGWLWRLIKLVAPSVILVWMHWICWANRPPVSLRFVNSEVWYMKVLTYGELHMENQLIGFWSCGIYRT